MPNRNTDNEREKYDHSGHSTQRRQEGDLKAPGSPAGPASDPTNTPRANQPVPRPR
jgi:hypothetical protein